MRISLHQAACGAVIALAAGGAPAAVDLPGGDLYQNGDFDFSYGETGLGYLTVYQYTGELAVTEAPTTTAITTDLTYAYTYAGFGTSTANITYFIGNEGVDAFNDIRILVQVQTDGSDSFNDQGKSVWGAAAADDPAHFRIADFASENLNFEIVANNGLDDSDTCGGVCDVDFALQWNIPTILPGELYAITVGLSDAGVALSGRWLEAGSVDTANTVLTFSGNVAAAPVPEPGLAWLFGAGLLGVAVRRRLAANR